MDVAGARTAMALVAFDFETVATGDPLELLGREADVDATVVREADVSSHREQSKGKRPSDTLGLDNEQP